MRSSVYGRTNTEKTIHDVFECVAQKYPERNALVAADGAVTYAELAGTARRIAHRLVALGVGPGSVVPVAARRSPELAAVLLGVLMAGGAYGVLDVRWPPPRVTGLLRTMRPAVVLADPAGSARLTEAGVDHVTFPELRGAPPATTGGTWSAGSTAEPAAEPVGRLPRVSPDSCATLFWTSGSTGSPKAVLSPHRATTRLFAPDGFMDFGDRPVMVHAAAVAWDAFSLELWGMLLSGGTVVVHEDDLLLPPAIRAYVQDAGATHLFLTPSLFDVIVGGDLTCLAGLRAVLLGGDKPTAANCRALLDAFPGIELYNGYGPVESCVFATVRRITEEDTGAPAGVPAGLPVPGTEVHVLRDGTPVPRGETGEVAIGGAGLALGYLDAPEQTAAVFRTVTADGQEIPVYLTGDQGRLDDDGVLHLSGRQDAQLKISGHRIEPAEIESAVRTLGSTRSVVMPIPDRSGIPRIILFAESPPKAMTEQEMLGRLRDTLPAYMVPSVVHFVPSMPLLDNTKINKRELSARFGYTS